MYPCKSTYGHVEFNLTQLEFKITFNAFNERSGTADVVPDRVLSTVKIVRIAAARDRLMFSIRAG